MSSPVRNEKRQPVLRVKPYSDVDQISKVHKLPLTTDVQNLTSPSTVNQTQKAIMKWSKYHQHPHHCIFNYFMMRLFKGYLSYLTYTILTNASHSNI